MGTETVDLLASQPPLTLVVSTGSMVQIWVPWGYSRVYARDAIILEPNEYFSPKDVMAVLGRFKNIRFHTKRLGDYCAEVKITRRGVESNESHEGLIVETLAGRCRRDSLWYPHSPDYHRLKTGQKFAILFFAEKKHAVCLEFSGHP